jgi:hypothetical protein
VRTYAESWFAVISCYLDESFDKKDHGVFAVGGLLGRNVPFFQLERNWEKLRKRSDIDIEYFKAAECERGYGQFGKFVATEERPTAEEKTVLDRISDEFISVIAKENHLVVTGIGVVQKDFNEAIKDDYAQSILGNNPYWLAYHATMVQCAWAVKAVGTDCVAFVCDEHEVYSPLAHRAYFKLKQKNPKAAEWLGTFSAEDDKKWEQLQAADACAFEIRRVLNLTLKQWTGQLRPQFKKLADNGQMFLIQHIAKDNLASIIAASKPGELNLDPIMEQQFTEDVKIVL